MSYHVEDNFQPFLVITVQPRGERIHLKIFQNFGSTSSCPKAFFQNFDRTSPFHVFILPKIHLGEN